MKVLVTTWGSRGDYEPYVALAAAFRRAGHDVVLAGPAYGSYEELATSRGIEFVPLGTNPEERYTQVANRAIAELDGVSGIRLIMDELLVPDMPQMFERCLELAREADVVVSHFLQLAGHMAAEVAGRPLVTGTIAPTQIPTDTRPPGMGASGSPEENRRLWQDALRFMNGGWLPAVNRARATAGLAPLDDVAGSGFYSPGLNLVATSPTVFPRPPDWAPQHRVTGYWFTPLLQGFEPRPALARFLEAGPPPVLIDFGSMTTPDADALTDLVLEAAGGAGVRAILRPGFAGIGRRVETDDRVFVTKPEIPHAWLLPRLACVVHHGGAGTTAAALRAGIPAVVVPHVFDQFFWASQVHARGAGPEPLPARDLTAEGLAERIATAATDDGMRRRAQEIARQLEGEDGAATAVALVERHLREGVPAPPASAPARRRPGAALDFPTRPEGLTPEWMTDALRSAGAIRGAAVTAVTPRSPSGGRGFVGRVVACGLDYDREEDGAPRSVVAKFATDHEGQRGLFRDFRLYEREVRFYQECGEGFPLPLPAVYHAGYDGASGDFLVLMEDLAGRAAPGDPLSGCGPDEALCALRLAARMHARYWESDALRPMPWLPSPLTPALRRLIARDYDAAWAAYSERSGDFVPEHARSLGRALRHGLLDVLERLSSGPATLVHGDYQLGNLLYGDDGSIRAVLDWQVVVRARGPMDVAHFLVRSLPPDVRRRCEEELVREYHAALVAEGVRGYSFDACWQDYRLAVLSQFGLGVVLSHALAGAGQAEPDRDALVLAAAVGDRLFRALEDLRVEDLLPPRPAWRRVAGWPRSALRRWTGLTRA